MAHLRVKLMEPTPDIPTLPYGTISPELENLLTSTVNKINREWPVRWRELSGSKFILESIARVTFNTHLSIRYLCAQEPPIPERKIEYALSAVPIIRSQADTIFLLVYLFEDLPTRTSRYLKGGWREWAEELARDRTVYGGSPDWVEWLDGFEQGLNANRELAEINEEEAARPATIPYWPIPGQMLRSGELSAESQVFLQYLNDMYYRSFSSHSHLSLPGLIMRSMGLHPTSNSEEERVRLWRLDKLRSDTFAMNILMCLSIMSEIEAACNFGLNARLRYIWGILNGFYGMARELFERRYDVLLSTSRIF